MAECSLARCQQERRAIKRELQRWTKNMVYILGLERVAEELMGRRKWKLYQDGLLPRRVEPADPSSDDSSPIGDGPPPALKIKTIQQINENDQPARTTAEDGNGHGIDEDKPPTPARTETILESLIRKPATQPKVEYQDEPVDWKPTDNKCHFCEDGDKNDGEGEQRTAGGATSPASESDSSSISGARSPAAAPPLLQHLLNIQAQNPQAIAQFQQMMAALAALGSGMVQPNAWVMQRLMQARPVDSRLPTDVNNDKAAPLPAVSPVLNAEQPLDLSAKSNSTSGSPPPSKGFDTVRSKNNVLEAGNSGARRAYTEDELQSALRDIAAGRLGTRRAAVVYGIPRSTLRNKVYKMAADPNADSEPDSETERDRDSPPSVILKIPTFPPPDDKSQSPAAALPPHLTAPPQPTLNPPAPLLLPSTVFADPPSQHLFTSLSDVIAKSISQKFQQPQPDLNFMRAPERHVSVIKTPPDNQRGMGLPSNSRQMTNNNGQQQPGGKGTRPKRGKYRNYDRDSLVEAVKAVQRGEMSVHRAGSYYGVPHSTLEYKVKERHLMRPRKREPKPQPDVKPQPPKPPPPKPPTKSFTNGLNGPEGAYPGGYGFWGGSFVPAAAPSELYASHMMRRLREEAPPPAANGSLLEGIIRSTLERPGAALLQRLAGPPRPPPDADLSPPAARRPRLDSTDSALAAEMREAVNRLRADKMRPRNGTPTPPAVAEPPPAPPAPPDRL